MRRLFFSGRSGFFGISRILDAAAALAYSCLGDIPRKGRGQMETWERGEWRDDTSGGVSKTRSLGNIFLSSSMVFLLFMEPIDWQTGLGRPAGFMLGSIIHLGGAEKKELLESGTKVALEVRKIWY